MKRRLASLLSAMILTVGGMLTGAPTPASAAGSGDVQCVYGNNQVVGIWVEVSGGTSGWATRWNDGYGGNYYSYPAIDQGKTYRLHVGCSGTSQNWGITFYSSWVVGYYDWICTTGYGCYMS
jgi:hypothetical protein